MDAVRPLICAFVFVAGCTELADSDARLDADVRLDAIVDTIVDTGLPDVPAVDAACTDPPIGECPALCHRERVDVGLEVRGIGHVVSRDATWSCDTVYVLRDATYLQNTTTITVEAGTLVEAMPGASLVVTDGSRLVVDGEADAPVVIRPPTPFSVGDEWRGLYLLGDAPLSLDGAGTTRTVNRLEGMRSTHGGTDAEHDCGSLRFLRLEFGGKTSEGTGAESLFLGACGRQTVVDLVQVHESSGDAIVMHGGGFDVRHVVVSTTDQDALQWEWGWNGTVQYYIAHLPPGPSQTALQAKGPTTRPMLASSATVANMTTVSPGSAQAIIVGGSALTIGNSIGIQRMSYLDLEGDHITRFGITGLDVRNSILATSAPFFDDALAEAMFAPPNNGNVFADPSLPPSGTSAVLRNPDWRPPEDSNATSVFGDLPAGVDPTDYAGAIDPDPSVADWTEDWTAFPSI